MASQASAALKQVIRSVTDRGHPAVTDRDLLRRFAAHGDQAAFTLLVRRHAQMVLGVCRRALAHLHDAEDACQATFLLLAQKAATTRWQPSVANWLHATARRVARNARVAAARRAKREARAAVPEAVEPADRMTGRELLAALDRELDRLPPSYREPLVLCCLEGLTRDEAAERLGVPVGTVKTRIDRGRKRLSAAMAKGGCALGAGLLAVAITSPARASSPRLVQAILTTVAGPVPEAVAALAKGVAVNGAWNKSLVGLVLMVGVVAMGIGLGALSPLAAGPSPDQPAQNAKPSAPPAPADQVTYSGQVVAADGRPVSGAKVFYHPLTSEPEPMPVRATTDARGRFTFTLTRADLPPSTGTIAVDPLRIGPLIAKADGFAFAWDYAGSNPTDVTLRLEEDRTPATGRIVDLQGQPLAGLTVSVIGVSASAGADLGGFVKTIESGKTFAEATGALSSHLSARFLARKPAELFPAAVTDAEGRFRFGGFARERLLRVRVEGPDVATQEFYLMTRAGGKALTPAPSEQMQMFPGNDGPPRVIVVPNGGDFVAAPGLVVTGSVRDAATGRPLAGAVVESFLLPRGRLTGDQLAPAVADAEGKYRFTGLPRENGNRLRISGRAERAYVPRVEAAPDLDGLKPLTLDVALQPGVWVEVRATDKATGLPVQGYASYFPLPDGDKWGAYGGMMPVRDDGTCRFPAAAASAIVGFHAPGGKYPIAKEVVKPLPIRLRADSYQAMAAINPKAGDGPVKVDFVLDGGRSVNGRVVGPDGKPLPGAIVTGLRRAYEFQDMGSPLETDTFTAVGLTANLPRRLAFAHVGKKLAGSVVVRGDDQGPVTVRLEPWAMVTGRLVDKDGKPVTGVMLAFTEVPPRTPGQPLSEDVGIHVVDRVPDRPLRDPMVDDGGRFSADGLIPGLKYSLAVVESIRDKGEVQNKWTGLVFRDLVLKPGEAKDLGDVVLKPFPKE